MLTHKDIQLIGQELGRVIEQNVTPALDGIYGRLDSLDTRVDNVENRLGTVENRLGTVENRLENMDFCLGNVESQMVTKTYLDDKLSDLQGVFVFNLKQVDQKVDLLISDLGRKSILTEQDRKSYDKFRIFPKV